jgi:hypothetical protein
MISSTYSISRVMLVLGIIFDDFGVDDELGSVRLDAELEEVEENVRFR